MTDCSAATLLLIPLAFLVCRCSWTSYSVKRQVPIKHLSYFIGILPKSFKDIGMEEH